MHILNMFVFKVFEATLNVTYSCPQSYPAKVFQCKLYGKGHLPEIEILEPPISESQASPQIFFNATLMGTCSCKDIAFKNVGEIACTVIMEISDDVHDVFSLVPKNDTVKMLRLWSTEMTSAMRHTNIVNLRPDEIAGFELQFVPKFDTLFNCTVKLLITDNPFETVFVTPSRNCTQKFVCNTICFFL